jgi:hypothetical protein
MINDKKDAAKQTDAKPTASKQLKCPDCLLSIKTGMMAGGGVGML